MELEAGDPYGAREYPTLVESVEELVPLTDKERALWASFGEMFVDPGDPNKEIAATVRYEWSGEYGDVPPRIHELEQWLFNGAVEGEAGGEKFKECGILVISNKEGELIFA